MLKAISGNTKKILIISIATLFLVSMMFFVFPSKIYAQDEPQSWIFNGTPIQHGSGGTAYWSVQIYAQANNYNGYNYEISLAGTVLTGPINEYFWWKNFGFTDLAAGDYTATFKIKDSIGTVVKTNTVSFSCWDHEQGIVVDTASKTVTWYATNSATRTGSFWLNDSTRYVSVDSFTISPLGSDNYSISKTYQLEPGDYYASMNIDGNYSYQGFSIAAPPAPPAPAPPKPLTPEQQASLNLSIEQQANLYGKDNIGFTKMLYDNILGRAADSEGLNDWVTALNEGKITLGSVVYNFVFSKELENKISAATPEEFVTFLYKNVLDRNPDPDGYNNWVSLMQKGMTKEDVLLHFIDSDEFKNICKMFGLTQ